MISHYVITYNYLDEKSLEDDTYYGVLDSTTLEDLISNLEAAPGDLSGLLRELEFDHGDVLRDVLYVVGGVALNSIRGMTFIYRSILQGSTEANVVDGMLATVGSKLEEVKELHYLSYFEDI